MHNNNNNTICGVAQMFDITSSSLFLGLFFCRLVNVEDPKVIEIIEQMKKFQHSGKDILNGSVIMVMLHDIGILNLKIDVI